MRRFVILEHTLGSGEVHYDLCLEDVLQGEQSPADGVGQPADEDLRCLVTFQLAAAPGPGRSVEGARSFDHRRRYLSFEGELSGGRGRVAIWDRGRAEDLVGEPRAERYLFRCWGERLQTTFELRAGLAGGDPARLEGRAEPPPALRSGLEAAPGVGPPAEHLAPGSA